MITLLAASSHPVEWWTIRGRQVFDIWRSRTHMKNMAEALQLKRHTSVASAPTLDNEFLFKRRWLLVQAPASDTSQWNMEAHSQADNEEYSGTLFWLYSLQVICATFTYENSSDVRFGSMFESQLSPEIGNRYDITVKARIIGGK